MMMLLSDLILHVTMTTTTTEMMATSDDGGDNAYDNEAGNDGFGNNDSGEYEEDVAMEEAKSGVDNSESSAGPSAGPTINAGSTPIYSHSIEDVPPLHRRIIEKSMGLYWDIDSPRDFQVIREGHESMSRR